MLKAMPSPKGTNHARRFVVDRSIAGAYDAVAGLTDEHAVNLLEFLRDKLSQEDFVAVTKLVGVDPYLSMDDDHDIDGPTPFRGMPLRGGGKFGQDKKPGGLSAATRAAMARIKVIA